MTMFKGSMVAIVTPMHDNGEIDYRAMQQLVEWHIEAKTTAIVVAGTTGESVTLTATEHAELIALVVKQVANRIPVMAGTGTNSTKTTLQLTENAKKAGADAALIVTPYYNKPPQNGLYEHYKTVAETISFPIILYNVPSRTACDLLPDTVERLAKIKNIIGIKEATGKIERAQEIRERCDKSFAIYSGDDATALSLMLNAGANGVISVTANVAPRDMQRMCAAALSGDAINAKKIDATLMPLHTHLFVEANPIPSKWALYQMNKIERGIRLPLLPLDPRFHQQLKEAMQQAGVIS